MYEVNHEELKKLIEIHYKKKTPLFIYGSFGLGKSWVVRETAKKIAEEKGKKFIEWNKISAKEKQELTENMKGKFLFYDETASQILPEDLRGLPSFNNSHKEYVEWKPNLVFTAFSKPDADGIIFFDELNLASTLVTTSLFKVFQNKAVGEVSLNQEIGIIGAGNLHSDKSSVFDLPAPLRDRMSEVQLQVPSYEQFSNWCLKNRVDARIVAFINARKSIHHRVDEEGINKATTPRGMERLSHLIEGIQDHDEIRLIASSTVGEATALEFSKFLQMERKIDVEKILQNPKLIKELPERELDLRYSLLSSITAYYQSKKEKKARIEILKQVVVMCKYLETEFSVLLLRMLKGVDVDFFIREIQIIPEAREIMKEYLNYLIDW